VAFHPTLCGSSPRLQSLESKLTSAKLNSLAIYPQAWIQNAGNQAAHPAALPAPAPEPHFSHPVVPPPPERTEEGHPAEPYTLSPGAAVAIAAAQLAEHPTQRGKSVAAGEGLPTADPGMVRPVCIHIVLPTTVDGYADRCRLEQTCGL